MAGRLRGLMKNASLLAGNFVVCMRRSQSPESRLGLFPEKEKEEKKTGDGRERERETGFSENKHFLGSAVRLHDSSEQ